MRENQPVRGRTMALATRYEVRTQVLSSMPAERLPAIWGRATLAMLVSSTSMKVDSMTVPAIHQGLIEGRQRSATWRVWAEVATLLMVGRGTARGFAGDHREDMNSGRAFADPIDLLEVSWSGRSRPSMEQTTG